MEEKKRLFFGAEIKAPWPQEFPPGRVLEEPARHMTLAFLGHVPFPPLQAQLSSIPVPKSTLSVAAKSDALVFMPKEHPRVVAAHLSWFDHNETILSFHKMLTEWLTEQGYKIDRRDFLPHVTIARAPFDPEEWQEAFQPLPMIVSGIHLYESIGNLTYVPVWSHQFTPLFDEVDHTADIAFTIRGATMEELHLHAQIALAFKFPPLLAYFSKQLKKTLDDIIIDLNRIVGLADAELGCPFKAVSFHGNVVQNPSFLTWEMIVDV